MRRRSREGRRSTLLSGAAGQGDTQNYNKILLSFFSQTFICTIDFFITFKDFLTKVFLFSILNMSPLQSDKVQGSIEQEQQAQEEVCGTHSAPWLQGETKEA